MKKSVVLGSRFSASLCEESEAEVDQGATARRIPSRLIPTNHCVPYQQPPGVEPSAAPVAVRTTRRTQPCTCFHTQRDTTILGHETSLGSMQKPLRDLGRLCLGGGGEGGGPAGQSSGTIVAAVCAQEARTGLPLLQVWPSDSPRGEPSEGQQQAFLFPPDTQENVNDSGIESIQASPSPCGAASSSPATTPQQSRRASLLHPDHARLQLHHLHHHNHQNSGTKSPPDRSSIEEEPPLPPLAPLSPLSPLSPLPPSPSSSTTSSLRSMPSSAVVSMHSQERRRSSRYSMFDNFDLEYAPLRGAARGSVGLYSLSESLQKLSFTQSLAFPALARGLASKQSVPARRPQQHTESGLNAFAKVVTALVLMLVSILVFGVVYKFART